MHISHGTKQLQSINSTNGYGYATDRMYDSLARLGHTVKKNDPDAPVQIWFDQPHHWKWNENDQYRIGYHPWESTKLKDDWVKRMNRTDEIWTPSPLIAQWYVEDGVKVPVHVYEHGVDSIWTPKERKVDGPIKFLHVGLESARKGGMEVIRNFRKAFGSNNKDVSLTMKMINPGWNIPAWGSFEIINRTMRVNELVDLFHDHHVYVYPSWGEGFGLTPLQAIATGMPTITIPAWAPYARFLDPKLSISSKLTGTAWPDLHPGKMLMPSNSEMIENMRWVAENYEEAHATAMGKTSQIAEEYNWDRLTKDAFDGLENRLQK